MKKLITIIAILTSSAAFSYDPDILILMLNSDKVREELQDRDITKITLGKENRSTSWVYTARIETTAKGLGPNGPDTRPCITTVKVFTIGGVGGSETSDPRASTACAMNRPFF